MGAPKKSHDATRAERKAKKRKLEDAVPDLPGDDGEVGLKKRKRDSDGGVGVVEDARIEGGEKEKKRRRKKGEEEELAVDAIPAEGGEKEEKKKKKGKKTKQLESGSEEQEREREPAAEADNAAAEGDNVLPRKSKKERKAERRAKEAAEVAADTHSPPTESIPKPKLSFETNGNSPPAAAAVNGNKKPKKNNPNRDKLHKCAAGEQDDNTAGKSSRFIVFVGNLPFTATSTSIKQHFASVKPSSIRHLTQRDDASKSKGCAFVEFDGYDHMKTCLKLFHHSLFDDGISPPRKINVELTAGGGGNTKGRRAKIVDKNQKLNEERVRRMHEEEKAKVLKMEKNEAGIDESAIHPSRRTRVPGA